MQGVAFHAACALLQQVVITLAIACACQRGPPQYCVIALNLCPGLVLGFTAQAHGGGARGGGGRLLQPVQLPAAAVLPLAAAGAPGQRSGHALRWEGRVKCSAACLVEAAGGGCTMRSAAVGESAELGPTPFLLQRATLLPSTSYVLRAASPSDHSANSFQVVEHGINASLPTYVSLEQPGPDTDMLARQAPRPLHEMASDVPVRAGRAAAAAEAEARLAAECTFRPRLCAAPGGAKPGTGGGGGGRDDEAPRLADQVRWGRHMPRLFFGMLCWNVFSLF